MRRVRRSALGLAIGLLIVSVLSAVALWQWRIAEHATKSAIVETQKAQRGQSVFLADLARQQREHNNFTVSLLLCLQALPKSMERPDRPYMAEAEQELYRAAINQHERVVFVPKWQRTSYDARGAVIGLSAGTVSITDLAVSPDVSMANYQKSADGCVWQSAWLHEPGHFLLCPYTRDNVTTMRHALLFSAKFP